MEILPLKLLTSTDQQVFGSKNLNFGALLRGGLPIPKGIAVAPPPLILETVLKHLQTPDKDVFEQRLDIIRKEIAKIPLPEELTKEAASEKFLYLNGEIFKSVKTLWLEMLRIWLEELRSIIWREGMSQGVTDKLSPLAVFFIQKPESMCEAYFDPDLSDVVIESGSKLHPKTLQVIDKAVMGANKKLVIPQIYTFAVFKKQPWIVDLKLFTATRPVSEFEDVIIPKEEQKKMIKSSVKVFLNLSSGFAIEKQVDGLFIEGDKILGFDDRVFRLSEGALAFPDKPVIFKFPDDVNNLIHQKKILEEAAKAVFFARNKKLLSNIEIAIPKVRNVTELNLFKKELATFGITRKSNLRFWLEMAVPENFICLDIYLKEGIDGAIFNLDTLQAALLGFEAENFLNNESVISFAYHKQVQSLLDFITPSIKILKEQKIPVLICGQTCLFPDVLDFLIDQRVYGLVVNNLIDAENIPEHIAWAERRVLTKRLSEIG